MMLLRPLHSSSVLDAPIFSHQESIVKLLVSSRCWDGVLWLLVPALYRFLSWNETSTVNLVTFICAKKKRKEESIAKRGSDFLNAKKN